MMKTLALALVASCLFAQKAKITTGPEPGATIPSITAVDQSGRSRDLASLTGPKGLLMVFFRSADW